MKWEYYCQCNLQLKFKEKDFFQLTGILCPMLNYDVLLLVQLFKQLRAQFSRFSHFLRF